MPRCVPFLLLFFTLFPVPDIAAQPALPFAYQIPGARVKAYDAAIPLPESVLGHRIGESHTRPDAIIHYFEAVAHASDRVSIATHARSHEGRPLIHAIITSPANHARLEAIRVRNQVLSDTPATLSDADLRDMPLVAYLAFSVHGNEASGSEAALLLLYHLAAGEGPAIDSLLSEAVIIIEPSQNPDGRARFTERVLTMRGTTPVTDPQDMEHSEPWPGGRSNHFYFDLNRDWLPLTQPESQGRIELFHRWRPQLLTDHHEMGSEATFFFQPGVPSRVNQLTLAENQQLTDRIGVFHQRMLDDVGALYYTREGFDDFYYGKGSTYPDVNGAVGILFEQAGTRSLMRETGRGTLDFGYTVRNQLATALSTLEAARQLRVDLLRHQRDFYRSALDAARTGEVKAYVVSTDRDPVRAARFAQLLRRHRIRLHDLARAVTAEGKTYAPGKAYLIPVDQPQARLVRTIMETTTSYPDSIFYDVSTWTLPLAYGLDYVGLRSEPSNARGREISDPVLPAGTVEGGEAAYAYALPWDQEFAPRALYSLLSRGLNPLVSRAPIMVQIDDRLVPLKAGTILLPRSVLNERPEDLHATVSQIAEREHVRFYALDTGRSVSGPDLGSNTMLPLSRPTIAILAGRGMDSGNAGEAWHLLSHRMGIPVSVLSTESLAGADLRRYDSIILSGAPGGKEATDQLDRWVRDGGTLIGMEPAISWMRENNLLVLEQKKGPDLDSLLTGQPFARLSEARTAISINGAIFEALADTTHPLAFGLPGRFPMFYASSRFFAPAREAGGTVARFAMQPLLSGYLHGRMQELPQGSAAVVARRHGRGRVVAFTGEPVFRGFWYGTEKLLLNALFFGKAF